MTSSLEFFNLAIQALLSLRYESEFVSIEERNRLFFDLHFSAESMVYEMFRETDGIDNNLLEAFNEVETPPPQEVPIRRRNYRQVIRSLSKAKYDEKCDEPCGICMETHIKGESLETTCKHEFGKECYMKWMNAPAGNNCCPTCREHLPWVLTYRRRKTRTNNKTNVVDLT
jgi:hypothetical protein